MKVVLVSFGGCLVVCTFSTPTKQRKPPTTSPPSLASLCLRFPLEVPLLAPCKPQNTNWLGEVTNWGVLAVCWRWNMLVYMGGSHRTTDMSPTANKRGGEEGMKGELHGEWRREKVQGEGKLQCKVSLPRHYCAGITQKHTCACPYAFTKYVPC